MEDASTSLPPPSVDMASANLGETASQHLYKTRIWSLMEGLYLRIFGHADLGVAEGHSVIHLSMPSRKR